MGGWMWMWMWLDGCESNEWMKIFISTLTIWDILLKVIAICLIALHMIVVGSGSSRHIAIDAGRSKSTRRLCIMAKFCGKLMYARKWSTERGEIHHYTLERRLPDDENHRCTHHTHAHTQIEFSGGASSSSSVDAAAILYSWFKVKVRKDTFCLCFVFGFFVRLFSCVYRKCCCFSWVKDNR